MNFKVLSDSCFFFVLCSSAQLYNSSRSIACCWVCRFSNTLTKFVFTVSRKVPPPEFKIQFAIKLSLNIPLHLKCIATLANLVNVRKLAELINQLNLSHFFFVQKWNVTKSLSQYFLLQYIASHSVFKMFNFCQHTSFKPISPYSPTFSTFS